jgi:hypothetical protein
MRLAAIPISRAALSCAVALVGLATFPWLASPCAAQPAAGSWEISGGGVFVGGFDLGERTAELTSNSGTTGTPSTFFTTDTRMDPGLGVLGRVGFYVTPALAIEGGVRFTRPSYTVRITDDVEDAEDVTAEDAISQYVFDGSAVWHFGRSSSTTSRVTPFVYGGAGYLRELHEGDALVEEGVEYHAGGGIKWWFGGRRRLGVRAEAGISIRDGGFDFEEKRRLVPVAAGSLLWAF